MIKIENCTVNWGATKIPIGNGEVIECGLHPLTHAAVEADPHEALKALEDQAPEVLRERIENNPSNVCCSCYSCERDLDISPWIPVKLQPPPKDGTTKILWRKAKGSSVVMPSWSVVEERWIGLFSDIEKVGEWMPISD